MLSFPRPQASPLPRAPTVMEQWRWTWWWRRGGAGGDRVKVRGKEGKATGMCICKKLKRQWHAKILYTNASTIVRPSTEGQPA